MYKFAYLIFLIIIALSQAQAGLLGFTVHSRANCINNESISWDARHNNILKTESEQYKSGKLEKVIKTPWENTWRSAAVSWFISQPWSGWHVIGKHWLYQGYGIVVMFKTQTSNCSIYNGWWGASDIVTQNQKPKVPLNNDISKVKTKLGLNSNSVVSIVETEDMDIPVEQKKELLQKSLEQQNNNYITPNLTSKNIPKDIKIAQAKALKDKSSYDLNFNFDEKSIFKDEVIIRNYPLGVWDYGWTGVGVDFKDKKLGTCSYRLIKLEMSNARAEIAENVVSYEVNDNTTVYRAEKINDNIIYKVDWFDNNSNWSNLECSKKQPADSFKDSFLIKANNIDDNLNKKFS